jgi:hypothetical protein
MKRLHRSLDGFLYHRQEHADEPSKDGHITVKNADDKTEFEVQIVFSDDVDVIPMKRYPISFKELTGCDSIKEFQDKVRKSKEQQGKGYL